MMTTMLLMVLGILLFVVYPLYRVVKHIHTIIKREYVFDLKILRLKGNKLTFKKDFEKHRLPIIRLVFFGVEYNFLLDTGADVNLINESVFDKIKALYSVNSTDNKSIITASGLEKSTKTNLEFSTSDSKFNEEFVIMNLDNTFNMVLHDNAIQLHGVLGSKFFLDNKWSLDFNNMVIWTK